MKHRLHVPNVDESTPLALAIALSDGMAHYCRSVLRLKVGTQLEVFNGRGLCWQGELSAMDKKSVHISLLMPLQAVAESPVETVLLQGVSRGERMDYSLQKATELGVNVIVPVMSKRTQVKLTDDKSVVKKMQHWSGVLEHATAQSNRSHVPNLALPLPWAELLQRFPLDGTGQEARLILDPTATVSFADWAKTLTFIPSQVTVLVGPEGGFASEEVDSAIAAGFQPVSLGSRILRTETVAPVILTLIQARWGDF